VTERDSRLYSRGQVVRFVGEGLKRRGVPSRPLPIVLLVGPRGSGGTALLGRLWADFGADSPGVHLDLASAQTAADVVFAAMQGLRRKIPGIRVIGFDRLRLAFKALSFVDDGGGRAAFDVYMKAGGRSAVVSSLMQDWANRAAPLLRSPDQQVLAAFLGPAVGGLLSGIDHHRDKRALQWHADNGISAGGSGYDALWELCGRQHERTDEASRDVEKTLCAALLADLRADFNDAALFRGRRTSNCLLLLDNAGTKAGDRLLELLEESRRDTADEAGDPALVVAAHRSRPRSWVGEPVPATDGRLSSTRLADVTDGWWFPVRLTDLSGEDVLRMTKSSVLGSARRDADFVHALTGGHPEAVRQLGTLLVQVDRSVLDARRLLEHKLGPGREPTGPRPSREAEMTVEDYLLKRIFADEVRMTSSGVIEADDNLMLDAMAVCAATPGLRLGASQAAFRFLGWTQIGATDARDRLASAMWLDQASDEVGAARPNAAGLSAARPNAVGLHPLAGLLLRRWLARDPDKWRDVHSGYVASYARAQDAALRQFHRLALVEPSRAEDFSVVVEALDAELARCSAQEWLNMLDTIAGAPNRLRTTRDPRAFATTLAGVAEPGNRRRVVARLTAARWLYHDRYFDPSHRLAQLIANEYDNLAQLSTPDGEVFFEESARYRHIEHEWED
jgi:hypothetical protein